MYFIFKVPLSRQYNEEGVSATSATGANIDPANPVDLGSIYQLALQEDVIVGHCSAFRSEDESIVSDAGALYAVAEDDHEIPSPEIESLEITAAATATTEDVIQVEDAEETVLDSAVDSGVSEAAQQTRVVSATSLETEVLSEDDGEQQPPSSMMATRSRVPPAKSNLMTSDDEEEEDHHHGKSMRAGSSSPEVGCSTYPTVGHRRENDELLTSDEEVEPVTADSLEAEEGLAVALPSVVMLREMEIKRETFSPTSVVCLAHVDLSACIWYIAYFGTINLVLIV